MSYENESLRVAVLMGGVSSEREVSKKSGKAVCEALTACGHEVHPVDIIAEDIREVVALKPDVAFIALHGYFGEDGGVQTLLENASMPFTGSDSVASRMAMDKLAAKERFMSRNVPTPACRVVTKPAKGQALRAVGPLSPLNAISVGEAAQELGLPIVVKPVREGSSFGVSLVSDVGEVMGALDAAFRFGSQVMLEEFVGGRELTVGILAEAPLPVVEIQYEGKLFDFDAKYRATTTVYTVNPALTPAEAKSVQQAALAAHRALGCRGYSRVDVRLDNGNPSVLEVNTIPGFTSRSLFPMAARAAGIEFPQLCDRLLREALKARDLAQARVAG
jgi:D-alanine-D-alanine ligase